MYPRWESETSVNIDSDIHTLEYKYIIKSGDNIRWEDGANRKVDLPRLDPNTVTTLLIEDTVFNATHLNAQVGEHHPGPLKQAPHPHIEIPPHHVSVSPSNWQEEEKKSQPQQQTDNKGYLKAVGKAVYVDIDQIRSPVRRKEEFKLQHTQSLTIDMLKDLQVLNQEKGTWKQKLEVVAQLVDTYKNFNGFHTEGLAILASYLYFVNSHQIKCAENGTHFRPNHHANIAYQLYQTLDKELTTEDNSFIIRSLKQNLFTVAVPLTRIRDIAHRGDIPQDLKNEIKHRLQNKLHRSADPGDLKTCEEILHKVRNGNYSGEFKHQYEIFYEELKEFFNGMGLDKLLNQVKQGYQGKSQLNHTIQEFLNKKGTNQINESNLQLITALRLEINKAEEEVFGDHNSKTVYQYLQLADIEIEKYLFMKLSEILSGINSVNSQQDLKRVLSLTQVSVSNMLLSHLFERELSIIQNELISFGIDSDFDPSNHVLLRRLKATVERGVRLGKTFTSKTLEVFQTNVIEIGKAFSIDRHSAEVFSESFVRSHLVFQYSKALELILQYIRRVLQLPPFIIISQGSQKEVYGNLKYCYNLLDLIHVQPLINNQKIIVLLESADGTEEIPSNVVGVLLKHDLPQLSHLAIRARQSGCIFVCCENDLEFDKIHKQIQGNEFCKMFIQNEKAVIEKASIHESVPQATSPSQQKELKIESQALDKLKEMFESPYFDLVQEMIDANKSEDPVLLGSKSVNSLKLTKIAKQLQQEVNFMTPSQITVPMTALQYLLIKDEAAYYEYVKLLTDLDKAPIYMIQPLREKVIRFMQGIQRQNSQDIHEIVKHIQKHFKDLPNDTLVAVRSSSTLEDLSKMAGAGLFDSFLNIQLYDSAQLGQAIVGVWLSLFTERAIISRNQYQISSFQAQMSVLIQQQIHSDFSFIIHTRNPINQNENEIYMEIAVGLGETLASANQQGTPYRLIFNKDNMSLQILSFANYSTGLFAHKGSNKAIDKEIDYSTVVYSKDAKQLIELGKRLGQISHAIEKSYGGFAQDIEGAIVTDGSDTKIYVVQTRSQI